MTPPWFYSVWEYMSEAQKEGVRWKADFERLDLSTVLALWPELAPPALRHLIPASRVNEIHVLPENDLITHEDDDGCVCGPDVTFVEGGKRVTHHSLDGREEREDDA